MAACRKAGFQPNAGAVRSAAIELAGGVLTDQGLIVLPGKGSISPADFARSLRNQMPEAFGALSNDAKPSGNLTADMRREIAARRNRGTAE